MIFNGFCPQKCMNLQKFYFESNNSVNDWIEKKKPQIKIKNTCCFFLFEKVGY